MSARVRITEEHPCSQGETIATLRANLNNMNNNIKEIKESIKEINLKFDSLIKTNDKKYASKWVESVLVFVWMAVWWTIITAIMYLIIEK